MNLHLFQISDSALPISGYTHSWGLEAAIARKHVFDAESFEGWLSHWMRESLGPLEGVLLVASVQATLRGDVAALHELNRLLDVSMVPATLRDASHEMGEQLLQLGSTWSWSAQGLQPFLEQRDAKWQHCVVFGLLGALAKADAKDVLLAFLHQATLGILGAGVRAIPIGHTHGQQMLAYLHDEIEDLADSLLTRTSETAGAGCPYYEVLCDAQTRLYARMFRS